MLAAWHEVLGWVCCWVRQRCAAGCDKGALVGFHLGADHFAPSVIMIHCVVDFIKQFNK